MIRPSILTNRRESITVSSHETNPLARLPVFASGVRPATHTPSHHGSRLRSFLHHRFGRRAEVLWLYPWLRTQGSGRYMALSREPLAVDRGSYHAGASPAQRPHGSSSLHDR